jgi:hypothetical protein
MEIQIGCVVEGHGDRDAVPVLLRRIAALVDPGILIRVPPPIRVPKSKLVKQSELERMVELAARKIGGRGAVLVLIDSDDDCPAQLGPALLTRAKRVRHDLPLAVVLAKREFESWFLASAVSLRGVRGLADNLEPPPDPEEVRGAKEWLSHRMQGGRRYSETVDQAALSARFDLDVARRATSFDKCYRDIVRLLTVRS